LTQARWLKDSRGLRQNLWENIGSPWDLILILGDPQCCARKKLRLDEAAPLPEVIQ
jgi:hypothetical protein